MLSLSSSGYDVVPGSSSIYHRNVWYDIIQKTNYYYCILLFIRNFKGIFLKKEIVKMRLLLLQKKWNCQCFLRIYSIYEFFLNSCLLENNIHQYDFFLIQPRWPLQYVLFNLLCVFKVSFWICHLINEIYINSGFLISLYYTKYSDYILLFF